ncbi:4073_t:CDS:2, partial [Entrophospora sp. SA101]
RSVLDLIKTRSPERMCSKVSNSYFVYRKVINDQLKDRSIKLPMAVTSALTSYGWNKASPEVKYAYEQLSKECEKNLNLRRNKELVWNPKPKDTPTRSDFQPPAINEQFLPHCYWCNSPPDSALIDFSLQNTDVASLQNYSDYDN